MASSRPSAAAALGGQAAFFFLGNVFTLLVGLPLQIYVARVLGATQLGTFSLLDAGVAILSGLAAFGIAPTLLKFIPSHAARGEYQSIRRLVRKGLTLLMLTNVGVYLVGLACLPYIAAEWPVLAKELSSLALMGLLIPLTSLLFFLQQGLRGFQEIRYIVLGSSFLQLAVKALLMAVLFSVGLRLLGYVLAVVGSVAFAVCWMAWGLWRKVRALPASPESRAEHERAWSGYAKVMYTGALLGLATSYLDRFLLGATIGPASVGVLVVIKQLEQMPVIFLQMFLAVIAPMLSAAHARDDHASRDHLYQLATDWIVRLSAPLLIFFFVFATPILRLYGPEFATEGATAFRIFLLGQVVNLIYGPVGMVLNMSGLERRMLKLTAVQSLMLLGLMVVLVPWMGLIAAAVAFAASTIFINVAAYVYGRNSIGLRWFDRRYRNWIGPGLACAGLAGGLMEFGPEETSAFLLVGYLLLLYLTFHGVSLMRGLHGDDREFIGYLRGRIGLRQTDSNP